MSLLDPSELASLSEIVESGMTSTVYLLRLQTTENSLGSATAWAPNGSTIGWLYSTPTPMITIVSGAQVIVNTYRLFVPLGTDIQTGDRVTIEGNTFTVSDTTAESTWQAMLTVSLRRVE